MTDALLDIRNLTVDFETSRGPLRAVRDMSLTVDRRETVGILGESGSGKTVTSLAVMGLLPRNGRIISGSVKFQGNELIGASARQQRQLRGREITMIFQDPLSSLNPVKTIGYQIAEMFIRHREYSKAKARDMSLDLMDQVGIPDAKRRFNQYPHEFSGGMRQRAMIAIAIALEPQLLIADEPTTALDVTVQAQIIELLKSLQRVNGMGLVLITHDLSVVADAADRIAVMYAGRVVEKGPLKTVYERPAHPYTEGLIASVPDLDSDQHRLSPIQGLPPMLRQLPDGCAFHPRCRYAEDRCRSTEPALTQLAGARRSACHFAEQVMAGRKEPTVAAH